MFNRAGGPAGSGRVPGDGRRHHVGAAEPLARRTCSSARKPPASCSASTSRHPDDGEDADHRPVGSNLLTRHIENDCPARPFRKVERGRLPSGWVRSNGTRRSGRALRPLLPEVPAPDTHFWSHERSRCSPYEPASLLSGGHHRLHRSDPRETTPKKNAACLPSSLPDTLPRGPNAGTGTWHPSPSQRSPTSGMANQTTLNPGRISAGRVGDPPSLPHCSAFGPTPPRHGSTRRDRCRPHRRRGRPSAEDDEEHAS